MLFDAQQRYSYQDLPKFLIYAIQMYIPNYGDKPMIPFLIFGKFFKNMTIKETTKGYGTIRYKKVKNWRERKINQQLQKFIDITNTSSGAGGPNEKNFIDDILINLLRLI